MYQFESQQSGNWERGMNMITYKNFGDSFRKFFDYKIALVILILLFNMRLTYDINLLVIKNGLLCFFITLYIYLILGLLYLSRAFEILMLYIDGARPKYTKSEISALEPVWCEVENTVAEQTWLKKDKIHLNIIDSMGLVSYSLPHNIIISRGLIETLDREQLKAVLAHEFSHIVNFDCQIHFIILFFTNLYLSIAAFFSYVLKKIAILIGWTNLFALIIRFLAFIISFAPNLLYFCLSFLLCGNSRKNEFQADLLAAKFGYKEPLMKALYLFYDIEISDKKELLHRLLEHHPKIAYRIIELEK